MTRLAQSVRRFAPGTAYLQSLRSLRKYLSREYLARKCLPRQSLQIGCLVLAGVCVTAGCQKDGSPETPRSPEPSQPAVSQQPSPQATATPAETSPSELEWTRALAQNENTPPVEVPAEFAQIIRGLLAAQAGLEFDGQGRLIGVDLAGERRSGSDAEIMLAVKLKHLRRFRVAGFGVTNEGVRALAQAKTIEELTLENTQIDDEGLQSLAALPRLWSLNLRRSVKLSDRAIATLASFPRLTHLYLLENQFSAEGLAQLVHLKQLRLLDLRNCGAVNAELCQQLAGLENLVALRLRGYNIDDRCLEAVAQFAHLSDFSLEESPATNAGLQALGKLPLVSVTLFRCNAINDDGLRVVKSWPRLRALNLRDMPVQGTFFDLLPQLKELRTLVAVQCMVDDQSLKHLAACRQLEDLALGQTLLTDQGLASLAQLTSLRRLDLSQTQVTDQGLTSLVAMQQLQSLDLRGNLGVTDAAVDWLLKLPQLEEVFLDGTSVSREALARLGPRAKTKLAAME